MAETEADAKVTIPRLENCGVYWARDNSGFWHYLNHAGSWQGFRGPVDPDPLLEAPKEIESAVFGTSLGDEPDVYADYDRLTSLHAKISDVIAKAEGRS